MITQAELPLPPTARTPSVPPGIAMEILLQIGRGGHCYILRQWEGEFYAASKKLNIHVGFRLYWRTDKWLYRLTRVT